jgi:flavorubredoxin
MLLVSDFFIRPVAPMNDGDVLDLGYHKLRFLLTPHVPHAWDAILVYEETTGTLLASDLFTQLGERAAITESDIVGRTLETQKLYPDYLPIGPHTAKVFDRLQKLSPRVLASHHGPA